MPFKRFLNIACYLCAFRELQNDFSFFFAPPLIFKTNFSKRKSEKFSCRCEGRKERSFKERKIDFLYKSENLFKTLLEVGKGWEMFQIISSRSRKNVETKSEKIFSEIKFRWNVRKTLRKAFYKKKFKLEAETLKINFSVSLYSKIIQS